MDNAKLDAAARNGCSVSVALYSSGGKDTYLSVTNGADVTLVASDRADVLDGVWMRAGDGVSRVLVENSSLTELATVVNMATEYIPSPAPSPPSLELTSLIQMLRCRVMRRQSTLSIKVMQPLVSQLMADR